MSFIHALAYPSPRAVLLLLRSSEAVDLKAMSNQGAYLKLFGGGGPVHPRIPEGTKVLTACMFLLL